ncbi:hypothetical protein D3C74_309210 [compost metagenome]
MNRARLMLETHIHFLAERVLMPEPYLFLDTERYMWITLQIADRSIAGWYGNDELLIPSINDGWIYE